MVEDTSEQGRADRIITTPKRLRSKVFLVLMVIGSKFPNKDKAFCPLCEKQLPYSTTTTNPRTQLRAATRARQRRRQKGVEQPRLPIVQLYDSTQENIKSILKGKMLSDQVCVALKFN